MKRILLILSLLIAMPVFGMQTAHASVWSWSSLISRMTNAVSQKPALVGLGALAVAAATYGIYSFYKKQPQVQLQAPRPKLELLYLGQDYKPAQETLKNISPHLQKNYKDFLVLLKKATESDLKRFDAMVEKNMIGAVSFDCLHVWDMSPDIAQQAPLRTIKDYVHFVKVFAKDQLLEKDMRQAQANLKSLQEAVERFLTN